MNSGSGGGSQPQQAPTPNQPMSDNPPTSPWDDYSNGIEEQRKRKEQGNKWEMEYLQNLAINDPKAYNRYLMEQREKEKWDNAPSWFKKMKAEQYWMNQLNSGGGGFGRGGSMSSRSSGR